MKHAQSARHLAHALQMDEQQKGGGSDFDAKDRENYDEILATVMNLAEGDFQQASTDNQRIEVAVTVVAATIARNNAQDLPVSPLQFLYEKLIGDTTLRPSGITLQSKPPGQRADIPELTARIFLLMLWDHSGASKESLRRQGAQVFGKNRDQIDAQIGNTRRMVRQDRQAANLMAFAKAEYKRLNSHTLTDYLP